MGIVSRHGGSCDFAQDDARAFMAHVVAEPRAQVDRFVQDAASRFAPDAAAGFASDAAERFAPAASLVVILRAVAGSTRADAIARSAA
jgi:hypothetical protein